MEIIGRKVEQDVLSQAMDSRKPEFIVVYGRRRVGKTYLIKEYFNNQFAFYASGIPDQKSNKAKIKTFYESLKNYGDKATKAPEDWYEAFRRLKNILNDPNVYRDPVSNKRVVFLDEVPWFDNKQGLFREALDFFWNTWASSEPDLCLIVCGSATSWITKEILLSKGGFYNRLTRTINLKPFTLKECELFYSAHGANITQSDTVKSYMVFGGIPYYMNLYDTRMSLDQNIDALLFNPTGQLKNEYDMLFKSLFANPHNHYGIIEALSKKSIGMTRTELSAKTGINNGRALTDVLFDLEQCGFIRSYSTYKKDRNGKIYQIIDPYILFYFAFIHNSKVSKWTDYMGKPGYYAWLGLSFEKVCLWHVNEIKTVLGISGISSSEYAWRSDGSDNLKGAQIDLLIDRADNVINLCEMKYTESPFVITDDYCNELLNKKTLFKEKAKTKKGIQIILISMNGVANNQKYGIAQRVINGAELFS